MLETELPAGVTRHQHCVTTVGLSNSWALAFSYRHEDGCEGEVIVWRDNPRPNIRPVAKQRLRDLRPGDLVVAFGKQARLTAVEVYR